MDTGPSGPPGANALLPAPTAPCSEPGNATDRLTGAQSATATLKRQTTVS